MYLFHIPGQVGRKIIQPPRRAVEGQVSPVTRPLPVCHAADVKKHGFHNLVLPLAERRPGTGPPCCVENMLADGIVQQQVDIKASPLQTADNAPLCGGQG